MSTRCIRTLWFPAVLLVFVAAASDVAAATVSGEVRHAATPNAPIANARVTIFDTSLSFFSETRTDAAGAYSIETVPGGMYRIGCAALDFEYVEQVVSVGSGTMLQDFALQPETHPGAWDIIGNTSTAERFDLETQTWSYTGSMINPSEFQPAALLHTGEVLITWSPPQHNPSGETR